MEHIPEVRRGRRPKAATAQTAKQAQAELTAQVATATERQAAVDAAMPPKRRRRASVGGMARKLDAPTRPGFVRRFFNDVGNRLATALDLGYDFVDEPGVQTADPSSRINRLAGTQPNGAPLKTYLMETPDELYAEGVAEKEALNRQIDEAISAGSPTEGQIAPKGESYGQGSIKRDR